MRREKERESGAEQHMESGDSEREEREGVKNEENIKTRNIIPSLHLEQFIRHKTTSSNSESELSLLHTP